MKRAYLIEETKKGFVVWVNDNGYICAMCRHDKNFDWETCYFKTYRDAEQAKDDYNYIWND